jgi:DNA polymerase-3 subunit delta
MIFFLYGDDTFRSRAKKRELLEGFKGKRDPTGMNVVLLDAQKDKEERIFEELVAAPFLAEKRMLVIENLLDNKKTKLQKSFLEILEAQKVPESTILILWEEGKIFKGDAGKLFAVLSKEKYAQEFPALVGAELSKWVVHELTVRNVTIDSPAIEFIVKNAGSDLWFIHSLVDQLIAYAGGEHITIDHVKIFLRESVDDNIFNLVDGLVAKNSKKVFAMIQEQYHKGEDAQFIFAMIMRQFKILLQLSDMYARGMHERDDIVARQLGLHPFVVKKSLSLVQKYSLEQLKNIYHELLEIDIKTKTGQGDQSQMLDFFVGRLCLV